MPQYLKKWRIWHPLKEFLETLLQNVVRLEVAYRSFCGRTVETRTLRLVLKKCFVAIPSMGFSAVGARSFDSFKPAEV